jgi:hypothetical protein
MITRKIWAGWLIAVIVACGGCGRGVPPPFAQVTARDLASGAVPLIGGLGVPLGTVAEIEGEIVATRHPGKTSVSGVVFELRVARVDGRALAEPPNLRFRVESALVVKVAPDEAALARLITDLQTPGAMMRSNGVELVGIDPPLMSAAQAAVFREGYVGSRHRLIVYETGMFYGAPANAPPEAISHVRGESFGFRTHLVVLAQR